MTFDITISNDTYETSFFRKLKPEYQRVIELYLQCRQGEQVAAEAQIEGQQRAFFDDSASSDSDRGSDLIARVREAAGRKAYATRRKNEKKATKGGKKPRKTVANYERGAKKRGSTCPKWTDDNVRQTILRVVSDNPGKYTMGKIHAVIPAGYARLVKTCAALEAEGRIRREGGTRILKGREVSIGKWFPA
jgi:hypothetical protein